MEKIPLTNHQFIAYFLPGFVLEIGLYLSFERISGFDSLTTSVCQIKIPVWILFLLLAFIFGLILDAIRNGFIDECLDNRIVKKRIDKKYWISWSFFYRGKGKTVGYFYARYYTYYCFDLNMGIALLLAAISISIKGDLLFWWLCDLLSVASIIFLVMDAKILRREMHKATRQSKTKTTSDNTDVPTI